MRKLLCIAIVFLLAGCASIGKPDKELFEKGFSGNYEPLRIGIYVDQGIPADRVKEITNGLRDEFMPYGIRVEIPWIRPWQRKGFQTLEIVANISKLPLEFPCDRILVIIGRNTNDFIWGLFLPENLGAVENFTRTKGFVVGEIGSLNQAASGISPTEAAIHEVYHMLGCEDGQSGWGVYMKVMGMRSLAYENRNQRKQNFFPSMSIGGQMFWNRRDVELVLDKSVFDR